MDLKEFERDHMNQLNKREVGSILEMIIHNQGELIEAVTELKERIDNIMGVMKRYNKEMSE